MVDSWSPGTAYSYGAIVEFEGAKYKIIQPHTSQSDWLPPNTPALWGRVPDGEHHEQQQQPTPPQYSYGGQQGGYSDQKPYESHPDQKVDIPHEEHKKKWWDLSDERKKQLELGGGLLAGAAILGGGYLAYHEHEKNEEEKKALTWELQNWLRDAQTRTDDFRAHGPRGPTTWVLTEGHNIPDGAIVGGTDNGSPLYIARAFVEGGLQVGKAGRGLSKGASVGYKHKEYEVNKYEILLGDPRAVRWVDAKGALHLDRLNARPVEGGREPDGTPQYIAQAEHGGGTHPGKAATIFEGAFVPYGGKEKKEEHYRVLCYN
ncbi:carbohydrate-binding module family 12 protein [Heterobasidion irregulare TC 32-1]|uniref:Carbohydrate-binding module family 12 protein n=1 Tax=Heterobasidion irregulare (strain TC 32-1) TaxID=747525 RepID=W4K6H3_HETIT|nr:carbohydrate-binding module family 12 protein [Heterobasidion irregulare TC 32-1]ETW80945.1 carbohydrate-binding module family 12 protein [Heterobasidion irregulare TC 32-1]